MFRIKCSHCGEKISKKYEFCPFCGFNLKSKKDNGEYGFLGKEDLKEMDDFGIKMPFGFNMMFKPLMKELTKQMSELEKEIKKEAVNEQKGEKTGQKRNVTSFSIHIGMPGQKPIHISSGNIPFGQVKQAPPKKILKLPKISSDELKKIKNLKKAEPKTDVRRLADRIIYEISLPDVKSLANININKLETGFEIKAFSEKNLFIKEIEVEMPLIDYSFNSEKLILELGLK